MIIQATWRDGSRTNSCYSTNDQTEALRLFADGLTAHGANSLVSIQIASSEAEIDNLPEPYLAGYPDAEEIKRQVS